ncbi:hypothetical protein THIOM_002062 [Candidatus Thiomargarita nelsonii]|uniref:Uncharacterized protein n=1 Tax=Candidatus Thiomargarita nelsonii TaxID=1003181 RepID=A0A0A6P0Z7_9GAMM|nr:hypothetical protein THIOM_002062 [Candidatus Thiomargarita nelsonii]
MAKQIDWHRTFGLTLTDFFTDSNFQVELEKELTVKGFSCFGKSAPLHSRNKNGRQTDKNIA